ncbi:hypothetical protein [Bradyrhizobium jicamae]|uniref:hypothetical protein n=1 Tax=Bradyrhizobium jicamae TaxID=280332 RepID=UPI001BAA5AAC|nr:hypothetical protein [Bradyrhizobium jicamae]MBR0937303.1 hypothetical protein [Bradyrhizobium jicamae]
MIYRDIPNHEAARDCAKRHAHAVGLNVDEHRTRIVFGEVTVGEFGRLMVEHLTAQDLLTLHAVPIKLTEIDRDLRGAIVNASAAFAAATSAEEQVKQKELIGILIASIAHRHPAVGATIREIKIRERYAAL